MSGTGEISICLSVEYRRGVYPTLRLGRHSPVLTEFSSITSNLETGSILNTDTNLDHSLQVCLFPLLQLVWSLLSQNKRTFYIILSLNQIYSLFSAKNRFLINININLKKQFYLLLSFLRSILQLNWKTSERPEVWAQFCANLRQTSTRFSQTSFFTPLRTTLWCHVRHIQK